jgi:hypothetical protein
MENWRRHSIFWPLLLIAAGVFLFVNNLSLLPGTSWELVMRLWPLLLIAAGLDGFWRGEGYAGATVVTGLGVIFLLSNLGYMAFTAWDSILRLWPIILVAVGLDIIIGRRRPWSAAIGILAGAVITGGIFWVIINSSFSTAYQTQTVSFNLDQAQTVQGTISLPVGKLSLSGGAEGNTLLSGNVKMSSGENFIKNFSGSGSSTAFDLQSQGFSSFVPFSTNSGQEDWKVLLNPSPTYAFEVKMAVGESNLDLSGLKVSDFTMQTAVGKTVVTLPAKGPFTGRIETAVGETLIYLPKGAPVRVHFDRALTSTTQPSDFSVSGKFVTSPSFTEANGIDISVSQAIGAINVMYLP